MERKSIKDLAVTLDKAEAVLNEIRAASGFDILGPKPTAPGLRRIETAVEAAERAYKDRRKRAEEFDDALFGEPAWDILLDMFIHQSRSEEVTVKSACIGSGAPNTTALRWLKVLENYGLIQSKPDPNDQRRRLLALTAEGFEAMTRYLEAIAR
ncbi:MarR family winged helix-turn-helix transcriptional regulator [Erythrobacter sp.]|uniref:MarR family winged helix-turn-helix transcriptional regulator n=1 Tax=Erythrobacter sp. TaxID=1042 RepID=UPI001425D8BE|nr:MarR family winged helix-turn-helix transcriptional regulator [Erythrobacter sp.]QIQ87795.1 MAG: winged helix-turn-helix transcriptional regulator [Erythrobacter sp.]